MIAPFKAETLLYDTGVALAFLNGGVRWVVLHRRRPGGLGFIHDVERKRGSDDGVGLSTALGVVLSIH